MTSASERLAEYVTTMRFEDLPGDVVASAVRCVQDLLGVALAGSTTPWARHAAAAAGSSPAGPVTFWGRADRGPAVAAALANGTAAHALDYDDDPGCCHVGAVVIPAAVAAAEAHGRGPRELLTAISAGYDVTTRVSDGIDPAELYRKGYHPTSVCGVFGAAAAAGRLAGLDTGRLAHALGIAGSFSAGNLEFLSDGAMTKRLQAGKAASDGVLAARLAAEGFTGPRLVLEGPYGIWRYTERRRLEGFTAGLGSRYGLREVHFKKHACCLSMAAAVDGLLQLVTEHGVKPADVASLRVGFCPAGYALCGEPHDRTVPPPTVMSAQMSSYYSLAVAMLDGQVGADQFNDERLRSPEVVALGSRIDCYVHPALAEAPPDDVTAYLDLTTRDGRVLSRVQPKYRGHPDVPMSEAEMEEKFLACAGRVLSPEAAAGLLSEIRALPERSTLDGVLRYLRA